MKVILKNFKCWENKIINFDKNGLYLLQGQSGMGKSSIFQAIQFCLYDTTSKITTFGKKSTSVTIEFENLIIKRTKGPKRLCVFYNDKWYEDSVGQNIIYKIFGYNISYTNYLSQKPVEHFLFNSPSDKLAVWEELILREIDEKKNTIKDKIKELKNTVNDNKIEYESYNKNIKHKIKPELYNVEESIKNILNSVNLTKEIELFKNELSELKLKHISITNNINNLNLELSDLNKKLVALNENKLKKEHILNELLNYQHINILEENENKLRNDINKLEQEIEFTNKNLKILLLIQESFTVYEKTKEMYKKIKKDKKNNLLIIQKKIVEIKNNNNIDDNNINNIKELVDKFKIIINECNNFNKIKLKYSKVKPLNDNEFKSSIAIKENIEDIKYQINQVKLQSNILNCPSCNCNLFIKNNKLFTMDKYVSINIEELNSKLVSLTEDYKTSLLQEEIIKELNKQKNMILKNIKLYNLTSELCYSSDELQIDMIIKNLTTKINVFNELISLLNKEQILENEIKQSFEEFDYNKTKLKYEQLINKYNTALQSILDINVNDNIKENYNIQYEKNKLNTSMKTKLLTEYNEIKNNINKINIYNNELTSIETKIQSFKDIENIYVEKKKQIDLYVINKNDIENEIDLLNEQINYYKQLQIEELKYKQNQKDIFEYEEMYNKYIITKELYDNSYKELNELCKFYDCFILAEHNTISIILNDFNILLNQIGKEIFNDSDGLNDEYNFELKIIDKTKSNKQTKPHLEISILQNKQHIDFKYLSGGEQDRLLLLFLICFNIYFSKVNILLLDEVLSSLDEKSCIKIIKILKNISTNTKIIMVAHQFIDGYFDTIIKL